MVEESKERRKHFQELQSCVYPAQVLVCSNHCTQDLLHTLEWTVPALKTQPGSVTARESITSAWDSLHRAEVTRTERSELCTNLKEALQRSPPAEAESRLGSWAAGREEIQEIGGVLIPGNVQKTCRCGA